MGFMARRSDVPPPVMTKEELERYRRGLALLAPSHVEQEYRSLWERCKLQTGTLPTPQMIQQFVAVWKTLWNWKR
jgi:hypothetical protein